MMQYPPVYHMFAVLAASRDEAGAGALADRLAGAADAFAKENQKKPGTIRIIGPAPAWIGKVNDIYRSVFYIKCKDYEVLIRIKDCLERYLKENPLREETVQFDFDPLNQL